jgi:hypothetical protein
MIIEVDFDFLVEHQMSIEQYMTCYILREDKERKAGSKGYLPMVTLYKYTEKIKPLDKDEMQDLIDRGYLVQKGDKLVPDMLEVTGKFKQEIFNSWTNFEQLFEIYPNRIDLGPGKGSASLKSLDRPMEEMGKYYASVVRTKTKHQRILKITEWAKNNGLINMGIQKFVYQRFWRQLEDKFDSGETSFDNTENFETYI